MVENINFELTKAATAIELKSNQTSEIQDLEKIMNAEVSAAAAYTQVLKKFSNYEHKNDLVSILKDHEFAVDFWKSQLRSIAASIEESSGPWTAAVDTIAKTEKLYGDSDTIKSLKEREEYELKEYEEILENNKVNFQSTAFIKNICLDQQRKHLAILDGLLGQD